MTLPPALNQDDPRFELVKCPHCQGTGHRNHEQRFGRRVDVVFRQCRECSGTGMVLRGDPLSSRASLTLDYRESVG